MDASVAKYRDTIEKMPDASLDQYVTQYRRYEVAALEVAFDELEKRGRPVTPDLRNQIISKAQQRDQEKAIANSPRQIFTTDPQAPVLYAQFQIMLFSFFGTPITGSLMLLQDLKDSDRPIAKAVVAVIGFLTLFLFAAVLIPQLHIQDVLPFVTDDLKMWFIINLGGSVLLTSFVWPSLFVPSHLLDDEFVHQRRSVSTAWKYAIVALALNVIMFFIGKGA